MHYSRCLLARGKARRDWEKLGKEPGAEGRGRGRTNAGAHGKETSGRQSSQAVRILGRQTWRLAHRRLSVNMCGKRRTTTERVSERLQLPTSRVALVQTPPTRVFLVCKMASQPSSAGCEHTTG